MVGVWVKRSLRYYGARHLVFAGTVALTSAILCAALLTGESLQQGLRRDLQSRLGPVRSAVFLSEGLFPASLAQRLPDTQAALLLKGELMTADGALCADDAQIIGVASTNAVPDGLAALLNARGRDLLPDAEGAVRFERPSQFSVEMPLGAVKEARMVRRAVRFAGALVFPDASLLAPDFALRPASVLPVNVAMPYAPLAEAAGVPGRANLLVSSRSPQEFQRALAEALSPEDAGLVLEVGGRRTEVGGQRSEREGSVSTVVKSRRVFLPKAVPAALAAAGMKMDVATFHLADAFEAGTRATPYGFVAAATPGSLAVPGDMKDDEIVISAWLSEELGVSTNGMLTLRWRRFEAGGRLVADSRAFRVRGVLATAAAAQAKRAMPVFPGLAGVDSCAAWDVGMPMDEAKLKDEANEAYWKQWRETPKAFLTCAAGRTCFGAFFGETMSVAVDADEAAVRRALKAVTPAQAGFSVRPVWEEGLKAARGSTDFRALFAGLAFVLVVAALLLSALSLSLALETRKGEVALFSALGWGRGRIVRTLAAEWCVPLAAGALAGGGAGALLAQALVWSLGRFWRAAFAGAHMQFHFSWPAAGLAAGLSAALTLAVLLRTVGRFARCRPVELWQTLGREAVSCLPSAVRVCPWLAVPWDSLVGGVLAVGALAVMVFAPVGAAADGVFFGAGLLLLLSLLLFVKTAGAAWVGRRSEARGQRAEVGVASPLAAGVSRALQAPRRSAPVVVLLAVGIFLAVGILSMKHDPAAGCERPSSGSGGFASIVTSVVSLDRERGLELARRVSGATGVVPVRVREGDEAGCLNMSQPQTPRLLGLDARAMSRARAFEPADSGGIWTVLGQPLEDGAIPALAADQTMLQYSLKAKAGLRDGTVYVYSGAGGSWVSVRIVGALPVRSGILQGAIIVDEKRFVELFPDAGYRLWLCECASHVPREAAETGRQSMEVRGRRSEGEGPISDIRPSISALRYPAPGVTVETVEHRLRLLGSVESAYLDLFLVLGGLGVVLGVAGLALVILRSVAERRGELALLNAVGLPRRAVLLLLVAEYGSLVLAGLFVGVVPALVAIQPAARSLGGQLPWGAMAGIVGSLVLCASIGVFAAARAAARRYGPEVLKEEV